MEKEACASGSQAAARHGRWYEDACGGSLALELIGERWSLLIVREMLLGPRRFNELRAALPTLSAKVLTERLVSLEASGIVRRTKLAPPASVQVYGLTEWGHGLEPVLLELVRWGLRSPGHDPALAFTPVSLMLSLRALIDRARAGDLSLLAAFEIGGQKFAARVQDGELIVHPAGDAMTAPELRFCADSASDFLPIFYGKRTVEEAGGKLAIEGDPALAAQFIDLFALPPKFRS
ncbi:HxlR family transcriptional regulator [Novosphingobium sp. PhB165]|uniref:winged helix-turn-helix transcriptional regulator n=1 Tax=Novosphingobium sp. PhB165 TaxID=2485105 RepID=UPI00105382CF|nr:winged helix-turn-helix transcriptional regulator [Novosphingobium sp. PhB165]TCM21846.1 HxlR family transcriptional regulator [Novosphingobium sp. PhB165]